MNQMKLEIEQLTQKHNDVRFDDQLCLAAAMNVGNATVGAAVHQRWSTYMIPHLAGDHGKAKCQRQNAPHPFVEQKFQVISSHVQKTADQRAEHQNGNRSGIVWWSEYADLNVSSLLNPFCKRFGHISSTLDIHGVSS